MWSRVYVVIVLGMVGYKGQELAAVRRRGRFLAVAVFWARNTCVVFGRCLFLSSECPPFGFNRLRFSVLRLPSLASPTISFITSLTRTCFFLQHSLLRLFDYPSIPLDSMT
jgi:hypothetical protein